MYRAYVKKQPSLSINDEMTFFLTYPAKCSRYVLKLHATNQETILHLTPEQEKDKSHFTDKEVIISKSHFTDKEVIIIFCYFFRFFFHHFIV